MSRLVADTSSQDSRPLWLYRFARNNKIWRFNTGKTDYVAFDGTYLKVVGGIDCGDIEGSQDQIRNNPEATVSRESEIAELFRVASPTDIISVTIIEVDINELSTDYAVRFVGEVSGCKWDGAKAKLQFVNIAEASQSPGLKLACTKGCQAVLFGPGCNVERHYFEWTTAIDSIDGLDVVLDSVDPDLPYQGGELIVADPDGNYDRRAIKLQDGNRLTLTRKLPANIIATDYVTIFPGCDHLIEGHCLNIYNNTDNFRGRPHFAGKNPMGGNAVF